MLFQNFSFLAQVKGKVLHLGGILLVSSLLLSTVIVPQGTMDATAHEAPTVLQQSRLVRLGKRLQNPPQTVRFDIPKTTVHSVAPVVEPRLVTADESELLPVVRQKDISPKHQKLADMVLRALPATCRDNLKNFYVNYEKNPKNRGLGGASTIIVTGNVSESEFVALVTHECGHVADLGGLRGTKASGVSAFVDGSTPMYNDDPSVAFYSILWEDAHTRKATAREADFVSGYASSDVFEYFAETYAFYALQNAEFARLAKTNAALQAQYNFMRDNVFRDTPPLSAGTFVRGSRAPWDVTLLPYTLHASH